MGIEIFNCEQGSPEWFACRRGIVTASKFSAVMAKGEGKTRSKYMRELAGEVLTNDVVDSFRNVAMDSGKSMEAEARAMYAFIRDEDKLEQVGFIRNGPKGCSPDSLVNDNGALEIKCNQPDILIDIIERKRVPPEHLPQLQGVLWVAEREHIDFMSYWPKINPYIERVYRDDGYIRMLSAEVDRFNDELEELVERIRKHGT